MVRAAIPVSDFCFEMAGNPAVLSQGLRFAFKPASEPFDWHPGVITLLGLSMP